MRPQSTAALFKPIISHIKKVRNRKDTQKLLDEITFFFFSPFLLTLFISRASLASLFKPIHNTGDLRGLLPYKHTQR